MLIQTSSCLLVLSLAMFHLSTGSMWENSVLGQITICLIIRAKLLLGVPKSLIYLVNDIACAVYRTFKDFC